MASVLGVRNLSKVVAAVLMAWTRRRRRPHRDRSVRRLGSAHALAGSLLSYSLAAASPVALADTLVPAAAAAIIGGVSLAGGKGTPVGIAGGVLVLAVMRSGLTAIGVPPFAHDIVTGAVLLAVALLDAGDLERRLFGLRRALAAARDRKSPLA